MVDVTNFMDPERILVGVKARTKEEVVRLLVDRLFAGVTGQLHGFDRNRVFDEVMRREKLHSTGIGNGLAFPHARLEGWGGLRMALALCPAGMDFASVDGAPVYAVCLMVSSQNEPYAILQAMAAMARFFADEDNARILREGRLMAEDVFEKFRSVGIKATEIIVARDIARPATLVVTPQTSIEEVTRLMHLNQRDILPVVGEDGAFLGEISCLEIFQYGMPDFFKQLHTISFVRHIDPFERYFRIRRDLKVKDFPIEKDARVVEEATLLEVIFEMTVKNRSMLFVVRRDGTLAGMIDRFCVIDKVLFF
ncbi:MAG: PTS sugar transporter subunit IIA [Deltaproteobacteria bacterium]